MDAHGSSTYFKLVYGQNFGEDNSGFAGENELFDRTPAHHYKTTTAANDHVFGEPTCLLRAA